MTVWTSRGTLHRSCLPNGRSVECVRRTYYFTLYTVFSAFVTTYVGFVEYFKRNDIAKAFTNVSVSIFYLFSSDSFLSPECLHEATRARVLSRWS
jgi:hypothetical protein